jgi:ATP-dependent DNA ligase
MLAQLVPAPFHRPGWVFEEKHDGYRILANKKGAKETLLSRNGIDRTVTLPPWPTLLRNASATACRMRADAREEILRSTTLTASEWPSMPNPNLRMTATH